MVELTFTQEQKIKRFVSRFKFPQEYFERAVADCDEDKGSKNNDDIEAFREMPTSIYQFVEQLLDRHCPCDECNYDKEMNGNVNCCDQDDGCTIDPEFHAVLAATSDALWERFESATWAEAERRFAASRVAN